MPGGQAPRTSSIRRATNCCCSFCKRWRKTSIFYQTSSDTGDLKFTGIYFGGVVQY